MRWRLTAGCLFNTRKKMAMLAVKIYSPAILAGLSDCLLNRKNDPRWVGYVFYQVLGAKTGRVGTGKNRAGGGISGGP